MLSQGGSPSIRATEIVQQRRESYGNPNVHYARVAEFWNTWLSIPGVTDPEGIIRTISPEDIGMMMVLFKVGRESHKQQEDNRTDICGWTNVYEAMLQEVDV
jgi:hypothetical protein